VNNGVSIVIPTLNGGEVFNRCLRMIFLQNYCGPIQLVVVDSGSNDGTPEAAENAGAIVKRIRPETFNHSRTRNEALEFTKFEKVVFMVQDAIPVSNDWLSYLVMSVNENEIVAAYGQQVPHTDADIYARFEVNFFKNYLGDQPVMQFLKPGTELKDLSYDEALRRIRFDNVCAIYKKEVILQFPFPNVPYGEDIAWATELITKGYRILYQPTIKVQHSHNRPAEYRFRRAVVEALACADILGRVRRGFSFVTISDIYDVSNEIDGILEQKHTQISGRKPLIKGITRMKLDSVLRKLPFLKELYWKVSPIINTTSSSTFSQSYCKTISGHVDYVLSLIKNDFPEAEIDDLLMCIDQVVYSAYGQMLGEVYASHKLKGSVPLEIERFIKPFLSGV
jgi:glycosyltransferase involved in cell wall biosynthesis